MGSLSDPITVTVGELLPWFITMGVSLLIIIWILSRR